MKALTGLGAIGRTLQKDARPPEMPLEDILPDPDNPREPFEKRTPAEQQKQLELNEDVGERGVKSPISVRPHQTIPGKWVINYGHCRYEAATVNKLKTIPYFVDEKFDSYDQVNENELRSDLSPWALAAFIGRKVQEGQSKGEIAARLHKKNQNIITEYLALVDPPACLRSAYAIGVKSPRTLYDLRRAWDEYPEQVDVWVSSGARITRDTIKEAVSGFRHDVIADTVAADAVEGQPTHVEDFSHDVNAGPANDPVIETPVPTERQVEDAGLRHDVKPPASQPPQAAQEAPKQVLRHDVKPQRDTSKSQAPLASPKPPASASEIMVQYKGKPARVAATTTVRIIVEESDAMIEVPLSELVFKAK